MKTKQPAAKKGNSQQTDKRTAKPTPSARGGKTSRGKAVPAQRETRSNPARQATQSDSAAGTPPATTQADTPSPPKQARPKASRPRIIEGESRRPLAEIPSNVEQTREEIIEENRLLRREFSVFNNGADSYSPGPNRILCYSGSSSTGRESPYRQCLRNRAQLSVHRPSQRAQAKQSLRYSAVAQGVGLGGVRERSGCVEGIKKRDLQLLASEQTRGSFDRILLTPSLPRN